MESYINQRDKVVHKGSRQKDYQAIHMRSDLGNYPLCYSRPSSPILTNIIEHVDCNRCLKIIKEYEG